TEAEDVSETEVPAAKVEDETEEETAPRRRRRRRRRTPGAAEEPSRPTEEGVRPSRRPREEPPDEDELEESTSPEEPDEPDEVPAYQTLPTWEQAIQYLLHPGQADLKSDDLEDEGPPRGDPSRTRGRRRRRR
ncbi:MAG: hypothetical protein ACREJB_02655, partial [Planctomycetaceae bacterium]